MPSADTDRSEQGVSIAFMTSVLFFILRVPSAVQKKTFISHSFPPHTPHTNTLLHTLNTKVSVVVVNKDTKLCQHFPAKKQTKAVLFLFSTITFQDYSPSKEFNLPHDCIPLCF